MKKILGVHWFSNRDGLQGIVRVQTEYDGIKYYIGQIGLNHSTAEDDADYIAEWGSTFPEAAGRALFHVTE